MCSHPRKKENNIALFTEYFFLAIVYQKKTPNKVFYHKMFNKKFAKKSYKNTIFDKNHLK